MRLGPTARLQAGRSHKDSYFSFGEISTVGFKGSRFEFQPGPSVEFKPGTFESHCANISPYGK